MVTYIFFNLSSCSLSHGPNEQNSFNLIHKKKNGRHQKKGCTYVRFGVCEQFRGTKTAQKMTAHLERIEEKTCDKEQHAKRHHYLRVRPSSFSDFLSWKCVSLLTHELVKKRSSFGRHFFFLKFERPRARS